MKVRPLSLRVAILALTAALAVSGCSKKNNQQNADNSAQSGSSALPPPPPSENGAPGAAQGAQGAPQGSPQGTAPRSRQGYPSQNYSQSNPPAPPAPPPAIVIPAGSDIRVRLDQDLGSKISQAGDTFGATVADDVIVNGQTVIPRGARAEGTVIDARPLGRFKGGAMLAVRLERIRTNYGSFPVATSTMERVEKGKGRRSAEFIGGGGALGALIGGLAGGGKGALIGGLAGAGAGTAGSAFTGNKEILLPAETLITFRLEHGVHIQPQ